MDDINIAKKYISKSEDASRRGIEFDIPLLSFANIMNAKHCKYSGAVLTDRTRTIDRIDNSKGYVSGNVCAVHQQINNLKSIVEAPHSPFTYKNLSRALLKIDKICSGVNAPSSEMCCDNCKHWTKSTANKEEVPLGLCSNRNMGHIIETYADFYCSKCELRG